MGRQVIRYQFGWLIFCRLSEVGMFYALFFVVKIGFEYECRASKC